MPLTKREKKLLKACNKGNNIPKQRELGSSILAEVCKLLGKPGININCRDDKERTPLFLATCYGYVDLMRLLLRNNADVNADCGGSTALLVAARLCFFDLDVVNVLLAHGANVHVRDAETGETALHCTCSHYHEDEDIVAMLLAYEADVNAICKQGNTALDLACVHGHESIVRLLLFKGARVDLVNNKENLTILHKACASSCDSNGIATMLLEHGIAIDARCILGKTALHNACFMGKEDTVRTLLKHGANVHLQDKKGQTVLHLVFSTEQGRVTHRPAIVRMLLDHGIDVDAKDCMGRTALHLAGIPHYEETEEFETYFCEEDCVPLVRMLLRHGADANAEDCEGQTALHLASIHGHCEVLDSLLSDGKASVNYKDANGDTPLHCAAECSASCAVDQLIDAGADTMAKNYSGDLPLFLAAQDGFSEPNLDIIFALLRVGVGQGLLEEAG